MWNTHTHTHNFINTHRSSQWFLHQACRGPWNINVQSKLKRQQKEIGVPLSLPVYLTAYSLWLWEGCSWCKGERRKWEHNRRWRWRRWVVDKDRVTCLMSKRVQIGFVLTIQENAVELNGFIRRPIWNIWNSRYVENMHTGMERMYGGKSGFFFLSTKVSSALFWRV